MSFLKCWNYYLLRTCRYNCYLHQFDLYTKKYCKTTANSHLLPSTYHLQVRNRSTFRKVFDCVPCNNLLVKLWNVYSQALCLTVILGSQCVSGEKQLSNCLPLIPGEAHLFQISINDLPSTIQSQLLEFTDDTMCFWKICSTYSRTFSCLKKILTHNFTGQLRTIWRLTFFSWAFIGKSTLSAS